MTSTTDEKTHAEMLQELLTNEDLHDIILEGCDGVQVGALRGILAARSSYFQKMLLGKFRESSSNIIKLGYEGAILEDVVEYLTTEQINDPAVWN